MFTLSEGRARAIDATIKVLSFAALVIGGGWTLYTYFQTRQQEAKTAEIEAKKPFEEKRLEFCLWATTNASVIASSDDDTAVKNNTKAFWQLYYGLAAMAEDDKVVMSMTQFGRCLKNQANCSAPLKQLSLNLAYDCRDSIAANWNVKLGGNRLKLDADAPGVNPPR
jgi:hypothetical protein